MRRGVATRLPAPLLMVVVDDLDMGRTLLRPDEADAPLVIDADRMLPPAVSGQCLEPVSRDSAERLGSLGTACSDIFESLYCPSSRYYLGSSGSRDIGPWQKSSTSIKEKTSMRLSAASCRASWFMSTFSSPTLASTSYLRTPSSSTRW